MTLAEHDRGRRVATGRKSGGTDLTVVKKRQVFPVYEACREYSILRPDSTGAVYRRKFGSGLLLLTVFSLPSLLTFRARQAGVGAWVTQGRCHGFNAGKGNDRLCRFVRIAVNIPFWEAAFNWSDLPAPVWEVALAIRAFSVCPVCSLLGQECWEGEL